MAPQHASLLPKQANNMKRIAFCLIFLATAILLSEGLFAQDDVFTGLKSHLKRADLHYGNYHYQKALDTYFLALQRDPNNLQIRLQIANCYYKLNRLKDALSYYREAAEGKLALTPQESVWFANCLVATGDTLNIRRADQLHAQYVSAQSIDTLGVLGRFSTLSFDAFELMGRDSGMYAINPININTPFTEFAPAFYKDGLVFVSARRKAFAAKNKSVFSDESHLDLMFSQIVPATDSVRRFLHDPVLFSKALRSQLHEGPVTFSADEQRIVFTRNAPNKALGTGVYKLALYSAEMGTNDWENIQPLPFDAMKSHSFGHPSLSTDGKTLYFVSDMPGGSGGTDIYVSSFNGLTWSDPVNLGPEINTPGDEMFPFIHNNRTLYFSSNGHAGLGGLDVFSVHVSLDSIGMPLNLGLPVNSPADDFGFVLDPVGAFGFFSSNRKSGGGKNDDIYSVFIDKSKRGRSRIYYRISGTVNYQDNTFQRKASEPLPAAKVMLFSIDEGDQTLLNSIETGMDGKFSLDILRPGSYKLQTTKENFQDNITFFEIERNQRFDEEYTVTLFREGGSGENEPFLMQVNEPADFGKIPLPPGFEDLSDSGVTDNPLATAKPVFRENTEKNTEDPATVSSPTYGQMPSLVAVKGAILDKRTAMPPAGAFLRVVDKETGVGPLVQAEDDGNFMVLLNPGRNYVLIAEGNGYRSEAFSLEIGSDVPEVVLPEPFAIDWDMIQGGLLPVSNISFAPGNFAPDASTTAALELLTHIMAENPGMVIEIGVHSARGKDDSMGIPLTEKRANALANSLVAPGIGKDQLLAVGYGNTKPLVPCPEGEDCSAGIYASNERVEFKVLQLPAPKKESLPDVEEKPVYKAQVNGTNIERIVLSEPGDEPGSAKDFIKASAGTAKKTVLFQGRVLSNTGKLPLDSALVYFYNKNTGDLAMTSSDGRGGFSIYLEPGIEYVVKGLMLKYYPDCYTVVLFPENEKYVAQEPLLLEYNGLSPEEMEAFSLWGEGVDFSDCISKPKRLFVKDETLADSTMAVPDIPLDDSTNDVPQPGPDSTFVVESVELAELESLGFAVQVGAYRENKDADYSVLDHLGRIIKIENDGMVRYFVTGFADRESAAATLGIVKESGFQDAFIVNLSKKE